MSTTETKKLGNGWKLLKMVEEIKAAGKAFDITLGDFEVSYKNGEVTIVAKLPDGEARVSSSVNTLKEWLGFTQNYPLDNYTMTKLRNTVNLLAALS